MIQNCPQRESVTTSDLSFRVRLTLNQFRNPLFDGLAVEEEDGTIVLSGRLPSFYLKQVAQTIAGTVDGVRHLDNRVNVVRETMLVK